MSLIYRISFLLRHARPLFLVCWVLFLVLSVQSLADAATPTVDVLKVDGAIVPVVADYISRGITNAEKNGSQAVIIELSTPGGLYQTTQDIVESIINARVPVVVYVHPAGSWAASAGTFITMAGHVSAMAPGTRMGAAHPVSPGTELSPTEEAKITEDAAAFIRSIATLRGKNAEKAESAVRQSQSFTDSEAMDNNLIDLRAQDLNDLLEQLNGRQLLLTDGSQVTLNTAGATTNEVGMNTSESFVHVISDPNIAYILLTIGSLGIIAEIFNPGLIFPGVLGGISLLVGFYSLGVLNASWGGAALILLAFALLIAEIFVTSYGILAISGIVALTVGSLILFSGSETTLRVSLSVIIAVIATVGAFFIFLVAAVVRGQRRKVVTGHEGMMGQTARVLEPLDPEGVVLVEGERWNARLDSGDAQPGEEVIVTRAEGLKLFVTKKTV
ncbi:MAG: nodulation protein NfeD [Chloroflexi bacterium]|nr:nodulation protein NfeD [Chloroflexota bacterium]